MPAPDFSDFTTTGLTTILSKLGHHYESFTLSEFSQNLPSSSEKPKLLLRHDCDFSLASALPMAEQEHRLGIKATYYILLRSPFYNAFAEAERKVLRSLLVLGHEVGLHFDPQYYPGLTPETLPAALINESKLLADICQKEVSTFSFHLPDFGPWITLRNPTIGGLYNAYSEQIFSTFQYCSDSNGYWRHRRLLDLLDNPPAQLYVLLHPEWWFFDSPLSPYERMKKLTTTHGDTLFALYEKILSDTGRENVGKS